MQSTSLMKFVGSRSNITAASLDASIMIVKHEKPFSDGGYMKDAWLKCAPNHFENFKNKEKIIQRINFMPLARNTVKNRIIEMAENVTHQQSIDVKT